MTRKSYCLEISTDNEVWFSKSAIYSLKEAKTAFENENVNELAPNSKVIVTDNFGNIILKKSN